MCANKAEHIDKYVIRQLREFDGRTLVFITKEGLELPEEEEEESSESKIESNLCETFSRWARRA